ncbi:unnamed protein product [Colias eurytheme]|nr:unnamed protein product [Colias eurytheme]
MWIYFTFFTILTVSAINRPVYKIILTQKGFAQFLQYDVETPPMREFTFCTWIKLYEFNREQSIFSYVTHGNNRVVRLWLDSGGRYMKVALNGKISSSNPVELVKDVWHNICLSYQSDYGAWALYIDGHLVSCEAAESLNGFVLPPSGSIILGYGTTESGASGGIEGEIFGANMILASTIERNFTMKRNPQFRQKYFQKNKIMGDTNIQYVVLGDIKSGTIQPDFETTTLPSPSYTRSYIITPLSTVENDVGPHIIPKRLNQNQYERGISEFSAPKQFTTDDDKIYFWNLMNENESTGKFKGTSLSLQSRKTNNNPILSEKEKKQEFDYSPYASSHVKIKRPIVKPLFEVGSNDLTQYTRKTVKLNKASITNTETEPYIKNDHRLYGQWTSSNFANSVINSIKSNNVNGKTDYKKVPPTTPLIKMSDTFPYSSVFKVTKVYTPLKFQRRSFLDKQLKIMKRDIHKSQIHFKMHHNDIRDSMFKSNTHQKNINITIANAEKPVERHRVYRNIDSQISDQIILSDIFKPSLSSTDTNRNKTLAKDPNTTYNLITILPFLKSNEYYIENERDKTQNKSDVYTRSLTGSNKWHNAKSYSNDFTPRRINMESVETHVNQNNNIIDVNKKLPSVRLKYIPDNQKIVKSDIDGAILKGRDLALEISNNSDPFSESVSILKYNHGFLPGHTSRNKNKYSRNGPPDYRPTQKPFTYRNNFNHNVKMNNPLNERVVIGDINEEQKYRSFMGRNDKVPDISRYSSDSVSGKLPSSLGPKVCKNLELFDRLLYIQPDESIDVTHIMSPVKQKNIAIEFILQNYKKCSLEDSLIENHHLLYIDWSKTPVRLFGGAYPKKTTDLCGFF